MRHLFVLILSTFVLSMVMVSEVEALPAKTFGIGLDGMFNYTTTSNEISSGEEVDNTTFLLRASPRAEYYVIENVPIILNLGILTRSIDRGDSSPNEFNGLFSLGTGYNLQLNTKFSFLLSVEAGGYLGQSKRETSISDQSVEESTDTLGFAFGAGIEPAYLITSNAQIRAGIRYLGLIGTESVDSAGEDLSVSTHTVGISLGFMYFF